MAKAERNPAIEFYRCLLMFGICWLHAITLGTQRAHPLAGILMCCVPGFVFISGWFGISFKPSKLIKLYAVGAWCAVVVVLIARYFGSLPMDRSFFNEWADIISNHYWFLNAYAALMLLAPLVNRVVWTESAVTRNEIEWRKIWIAILPLFLLVYGWSYLVGAPVLHKLLLPTAEGLGSNTVLTLFGIYTFAVICRETKVLERLPKKWFWILAAASLFLGLSPFSNYHFIFSSILVAVGFHLSSKISFGKKLARVITFIAPSMFSVYLLHSVVPIFKLIERLENPMIETGGGLLLVTFVFGSGVFMLAICCDMIRRLVVQSFWKPCKTACERIDRICDNIVTRLSERSGA